MHLGNTVITHVKRKYNTSNHAKVYSTHWWTCLFWNSLLIFFMYRWNQLSLPWLLPTHQYRDLSKGVQSIDPLNPSNCGISIVNQQLLKNRLNIHYQLLFESVYLKADFTESNDSVFSVSEKCSHSGKCRISYRV